jgi:hypothetical protein
VLAPAPSVISEILDNEVVIIDMSTGYYFNMTGSATNIWQCLMDGTTPEKICESLRVRFGAVLDIPAAVDTFLEQLRAEGLIEDAGSEPPPAEPVGLAPELSQTPTGEQFQPPSFEKFTDMAHILLADPVHDADPTRGWPSTR